MIQSDPHLELYRRAFTPGRVDGSVIQPANLANLPIDAIAALQVRTDQGTCDLADLFEIKGQPSQHVRLHGDCAMIDRLGFEMRGGTLSVDRNCGDYLGWRMRSGRIEVHGSAGHYTAAAMRNGTVMIRGNVGDQAAGRGTGDPMGMRGGTLVVEGNAGNDLGQRMRRGVVYVQGNAGSHGAWSMIAGTVIVLGQLGPHWCQGMRRGTLVLKTHSTESLAGQFTSPHELELSFLSLLWNFIRENSSNTSIDIPTSRHTMRQVGDRAIGGLGEVLTLVPTK
jgi:formylmethanofuran dehydrogenase subunit C